MGTTLTGTTPQDTYDSLIKVTDNGPLSGTAKYLSDGLGNDSILALSTAAVGIGTSTPFSRLHVQDSVNLGTIALGNNSFPALVTANAGSGAMVLDNRAGVVGWIEFRPSGNGVTQGAEVARFTSSGLTFNGDTAAANALDDYEEGTWTPTFTDTLGNNVTATNVGRYTKIGRQVTLSLTTTWSNKGAAGAGSLVYMSGVPFNMNNKANGIVTYYDDMNLTTVGAFTIANAGTSLCYFPIQDNAVEASFLTFGETTNTSTFWFTLTYFV
jgi:hypothetical protein